MVSPSTSLGGKTNGQAPSSKIGSYEGIAGSRSVAAGEAGSGTTPVGVADGCDATVSFATGTASVTDGATSTVVGVAVDSPHPTVSNTTEIRTMNSLLFMSFPL
jgi:hypothetical protein